MRNIKTTFDAFNESNKEEHEGKTAFKKKLGLSTDDDAYDGSEKIDGYDDETRKKLSPLIPKMTMAFVSFLDNKNDVEGLESALSVIEKEARKLSGNKKPDCGLWWRFFKGDTAANDKANVCRDLSNGKSNRDYAIENMELAISEPDGISLYFS